MKIYFIRPCCRLAICWSWRKLEKIVSETDLDKLNAWFQLSLKAASIEEFEENM